MVSTKTCHQPGKFRSLEKANQTLTGERDQLPAYSNPTRHELREHTGSMEYQMGWPEAPVDDAGERVRSSSDNEAHLICLSLFDEAKCRSRNRFRKSLHHVPHVHYFSHPCLTTSQREKTMSSELPP